jgi:photosystem II stability/assembly factor-like uncharacterized protein
MAIGLSLRHLAGLVVSLAVSVLPSWGCGSPSTSVMTSDGGAGDSAVASPESGGADARTPTNEASTGAPDVNVLPCASLPTSGIWEDVTPPSLAAWIDAGNSDAPTVVAADPVNSGTVYVGTGGYSGTSGLLRTTDCGATWTKVDTGTNSQSLDGAQSLWTLNLDPLAPNVLYTNAGYGTNDFYKSTNGGVDWSPIWPPQTQSDAAMVLAQASGFTGNSQMDPYDHSHLLLTFHDGCSGPQMLPYPGVGCFAESTDGGGTWQLVFGSPAFEAQARLYFLDDSTTWLVPSNGFLWRTTDGGATWTNVAQLSAGGHSAGNLYHSTKTGFYIGTMEGVIHSPDGAQNWSLIPNSGQWVKTLVGTGTNIYALSTNGVLMTPETDGQNWTLMQGSPGGGDGAFGGYDPGHHLLVVSALAPSTGIWRIVTP